MKIFCSSCIHPFWTKVYLQVGEDWRENEIITTEVRHTDFVTMEGEQKSPCLGKEHLRPQEVEERVVLTTLFFRMPFSDGECSGAVLPNCCKSLDFK